MNLWNKNEYIRALVFAGNAHASQKVPGTQLPYVVHLSLVAMEVMAALADEPGRDGTLAVQCAALHDVMEDAGIDYAELQGAFGKGVADGVAALTKDSGLDKQGAMKDSLRRIKLQPQEIWMVKLADRITNLQAPPKHWSGAKIASYQEEARLIQGALHTASPSLAARLQEKIEGVFRLPDRNAFMTASGCSSAPGPDSSRAGVARMIISDLDSRWGHA